VKGYKCLLASYACFYLVNFHPKEGGFPAFEVNSLKQAPFSISDTLVSISVRLYFNEVKPCSSLSNIIIFQLYNRYHYTQFIWVAAQAMLALPMLAPTVR
jgi:hypothetical protein